MAIYILNSKFTFLFVQNLSIKNYAPHLSCRNTQGVLDKCMLDNLNIERPEYGYFSRAKIHHTDRPAPLKREKKVYEDATPALPDDYPRPPAKFGSRLHYMM